MMMITVPEETIGKFALITLFEDSVLNVLRKRTSFAKISRNVSGILVSVRMKNAQET